MHQKKYAWEMVDYPIPGRHQKPRQQGLTMIIDKGLGLNETEDLMEVAADYIDFVKLGFGTSALYNERFLLKKIRLIRSYGIDVYPGGTFLEVAILQNKLDLFLKRASFLGFSAIEVSDGTIFLTPDQRAEIIKKAAKKGFLVLTEAGKKDPGEILTPQEAVLQIKKDLDNGAYKVIIEGRESGKGIGIYDSNGNIKEEDFNRLLEDISPEDIIWEAPLKGQQETFISKLGPNVNLGNINPFEILALEALRVGLRGDTLKLTIPPVQKATDNYQPKLIAE